MRAVVVPRQRLNDSGEFAYVRDTTYRLVEVGDHVLAPGFGWGVVVRIHSTGSTMTVELFQGRDWIERQPFPEWDEARHFDYIAEVQVSKGSEPLDTTSTPGPFDA